MSTTLAEWVPAMCRANRFSRVREAFVSCFISFAQAFVSNCTSQRSVDKYCKLPAIPRYSLHSCMTRTTLSSSFCLTDPATLCVGVGLQHVSPINDSERASSRVRHGGLRSKDPENRELGGILTINPVMPTQEASQTVTKATQPVSPAEKMFSINHSRVGFYSAHQSTYLLPEHSRYPRQHQTGQLQRRVPNRAEHLWQKKPQDASFQRISGAWLAVRRRRGFGREHCCQQEQRNWTVRESVAGGFFHRRVSRWVGRKV